MLTNFKELVLRAQKELGVVISARKKSEVFFSFLVFSVLQISWLSRIADCPYYKIQDILIWDWDSQIVNSLTFIGSLVLSNLVKFNKRHRK